MPDIAGRRWLRAVSGVGLGVEKIRQGLRVLKRFFRSPKVIVGEIAAVALAGALGASLPQAGTASVESLARWQASGSWWAPVVKSFALDQVFHSAGFFVVTTCLFVSLVVITFEQGKRLRAQWSPQLSEAHFRNAPFRLEFEREPTASGPGLKIWTERRMGLLGSPMLHTGLLLVILAGALRALFGTEAVVDLLEGETLAPTSGAWGAQWPGVLGRPFKLDGPVTLKEVHSARYQDGDLRELKANLSFQDDRGDRPAELAVNHDLKSGGGRIFLGSDFGPAALLEWQSGDTATQREATLLAKTPGGFFEGEASGPKGLRAYLRTQIGAGGQHPERVEIHVMQDGALRFAGDAHPGELIQLGQGVRLALRGTPFWVRLRGSRDPALGLAFLGFGLVMTGVVLLFAVIKVDGCVQVTARGERERVLVALKPQRFAPLFQERFEQLVRESGAGPSPAPAEARPGPVSSRVDGLAVPAARLAAVCLLAVLLTGCQPSVESQARQLVEHYNQVVAEAYRRGDVRLIDPVVGINEGKKLTGLIGVRLDMGLTLDSQLLSLEITRAEQTRDELRVTTKERWRYRDRKIGTGRQVGEESVDNYAMLYVFKKTGAAWLVEEIQFRAPPEVGRKQMPWLATGKSLHGLVTSPSEKESRQP